MRKGRVIRKGLVSLICIGILFYCGTRYISERQTDREREEEVTTMTEPDKADKDDDGFRVKWSKLPKNCKLWLRFKHPSVISYPVLQSEDNDYYLHKDLDGSYKYSGTVFMDFHNSLDLMDSNTILYGHNMADGSMFGSLKKFRDDSYAKKHRYFYMYDRDGFRYKYKIWNVIEISPTSDLYAFSFPDKESIEKYIVNSEKQQIYNLKGSPTADDRMILLSTCSSYGSKRLCLQGYLLDVHKLQK